jgi:hypothetical protein
MWEALGEIAEEQGKTIHGAEIDKDSGKAILMAAMRVFIRRVPSQ